MTSHSRDDVLAPVIELGVPTVAAVTGHAPKAAGAPAPIERGLYGGIADQLRRDMAELSASPDAVRLLAELVADLHLVR